MKQSTMDKVLKAIRSQFGEDAAIVAGDEDTEIDSEVREVCPTGISVIDHHVLAIGGFPFGRMVEVAGEEGGCKTAFLYSTLASAQRQDDDTYLLDAEKAFDVDRFKVMGGDPDRLVILQPDSAEDCMGMTSAVLKAHNPEKRVVIGLDSLAASIPLEVLKDEKVSRHVGAMGRLTSQEVPKIHSMLAEKRGLFIIINQLRDKPGVLFGPSTTTPGGRCVKFMASIRLQFFSGKAIKDGMGDHLGKSVTMLATKTRFSAPFRKARIRFDYATGWDDAWSVMEFAKTRGVITAIRGGKKSEEQKAKDAVQLQKNIEAAYGLLSMRPPATVKLDDATEDLEDEDL